MRSIALPAGFVEERLALTASAEFFLSGVLGKAAWHAAAFAGVDGTIAFFRQKHRQSRCPNRP